MTNFQSLLATALLAGCARNTPPQPPRELAPNDAVVPDTTIGVADTVPKLVEGRQWMRIARYDAFRTAGEPTPETLRPVCVAVTLSRQSSGELKMQWGARSLTMHQDDQVQSAGAPWTLQTPAVEIVNYIQSLQGSCYYSLTESQTFFYDNQADCAASLATDPTSQCTKDDCHPSSDMFSLGDCRVEFHELENKAIQIEHTAYSDIERTTTRLHKLLRHGGTMWTSSFYDERPGCQPIALATDKTTGQVTLTQRAKRADGLYEFTGSGWFEPVNHLVRKYKYFRYSPTEGGAATSADIGLFLAANAILIDNQWLYFDAASCKANDN